MFLSTLWPKFKALNLILKCDYIWRTPSTIMCNNSWKTHHVLLKTWKLIVKYTWIKKKYKVGKFWDRSFWSQYIHLSIIQVMKNTLSQDLQNNMPWLCFLEMMVLINRKGGKSHLTAEAEFKYFIPLFPIHILKL